MSNLIEFLRGTMRTTRMIEQAKLLAAEGRAVYLVFDTFAQAKDCERDNQSCVALGIKFETPETCGGFDFDLMRVRGAHPNCEFLIDHRAIERRYAKILRELHRFDPVLEVHLPNGVSRTTRDNSEYNYHWNGISGEVVSREKIAELAREYEARCEAYDNAICTGKRDGKPWPATGRETALIGKNAMKILNEISERERVPTRLIIDMRNDLNL